MKTDLLADEAKGKQDITAEKEIIIRCKRTQVDVLINPHYKSGIGASGKGLNNDDGVSWYANSALKCLFSLHGTFFQIFERLQGEVAQEAKRIAFSLLKHSERAKDLRNLLPVPQNSNSSHFVSSGKYF